MSKFVPEAAKTMKLRIVGPRVSNKRAEMFDLDGRQFAVIRTASPYSMQAMEDLSSLLGMPIVYLAEGETLEVTESEAEHLLEVERGFNISLAKKCEELEAEVEGYKRKLACDE